MVRVVSIADLEADIAAGFCLNSVRVTADRSGPTDFVTLCGTIDIGAGLADAGAGVEGPLGMTFRVAVFSPVKRA